MRTVHETEALRPSDPVPKHHSSNPSNKFQRLRLTLKPTNGAPPSDKSTPASPYNQTSEYDHNNVIYVPDGEYHTPQFPPDIHFGAEELEMDPKDLLQLLQRQLEWATADADELKREVEALEATRRQEWTAKEFILENVMEAEMAVAEERRGGHGPALDEGTLEKMEQDARVTKGLQLDAGPQSAPWWRTGGRWASKLATEGGGPREDVKMGGDGAD